MIFEDKKANDEMVKAIRHGGFDSNNARYLQGIIDLANSAIDGGADEKKVYDAVYHLLFAYNYYSSSDDLGGHIYDGYMYRYSYGDVPVAHEKEIVEDDPEEALTKDLAKIVKRCEDNLKDIFDKAYSNDVEDYHELVEMFNRDWLLEEVESGFIEAENYILPGQLEKIKQLTMDYIRNKITDDVEDILYGKKTHDTDSYNDYSTADIRDSLNSKGKANKNYNRNYSDAIRAAVKDSGDRSGGDDSGNNGCVSDSDKTSEKKETRWSFLDENWDPDKPDD